MARVPANSLPSRTTNRPQQTNRRSLPPPIRKDNRPRHTHDPLRPDEPKHHEPNRRPRPPTINDRNGPNPRTDLTHTHPTTPRTNQTETDSTHHDHLQERLEDLRIALLDELPTRLHRKPAPGR